MFLTEVGYKVWGSHFICPVDAALNETRGQTKQIYCNDKLIFNHCIWNAACKVNHIFTSEFIQNHLDGCLLKIGKINWKQKRILKAATVNKVRMSEEFFETLTTPKKEESKVTFLKLFSYRILAVRKIVLYVNW